MRTPRPRSPCSTRALPKATGIVASTWGMRRSSPASSIVSLRIVPAMAVGLPPEVFDLPGLTPIRFVPNWVNSLRTYTRIPSPIDVSRMTEAMPMAIPSIVRAERRRCPVTAPHDSFMRSTTRMTITSSRFGTDRSPSRQGDDRIEARRPARRQHAEQCAREQGDRERREHRPRRRARRQRRERLPQHPRTGVADQKTEDPSGRRQQDRSEEHTSELQSLAYLVCRLLLEKKKSSKNALVPLLSRF